MQSRTGHTIPFPDKPAVQFDTNGEKWLVWGNHLVPNPTVNGKPSNSLWIGRQNTINVS